MNCLSEGSVLVASDDEPCYDTSNLGGTGAGWAGTVLPMRDILRFTNQLAAAIKAADPKASKSKSSSNLPMFIVAGLVLLALCGFIYHELK